MIGSRKAASSLRLLLWQTFRSDHW